MLKKIIFGIFIFCLSACSATGPKFTKLETADSTKATIYFYRPWMMLDGAAAPTIQIDGVDRFDLSNGGYHIVVLEPRKYELTVKEGAFMSNWRAGKMSISPTFKASESYFVRLSAELQDAAYLGGVMSISGMYGFGLVPKINAMDELKLTKRN